jgi:hypothetical protein
MLLLLSCTTRSTSTINLNNLQTSEGEKIEIPDSIEFGKLLQFKHQNLEASILALKFDNYMMASKYAMERRLLVLRKFETFVEPYFGTKSADECQSNLESSKLDVDENKLISVLTILTFGKDRLIKDCLLRNNTDWVRIELLVCGDTFYDVRTYSPVSGPRPEYKQTVFCKK